MQVEFFERKTGRLMATRDVAGSHSFNFKVDSLDDVDDIVKVLKGGPSPDFETLCARDFAKACDDGQPRYQKFGVKNSDPTSADYKAGLARFTRIQRKWDQDNPGK